MHHIRTIPLYLICGGAHHQISPIFASFQQKCLEINFFCRPGGFTLPGYAYDSRTYCAICWLCTSNKRCITVARPARTEHQLKPHSTWLIVLGSVYKQGVICARSRRLPQKKDFDSKAKNQTLEDSDSNSTPLQAACCSGLTWCTWYWKLLVWAELTHMVCQIIRVNITRICCFAFVMMTKRSGHRKTLRTPWHDYKFAPGLLTLNSVMAQAAVTKLCHRSGQVTNSPSSPRPHSSKLLVMPPQAPQKFF